MTDNFFAERREWSARKHALLTNYLTGFTRILGGWQGTVYYVDAFAGPGVYGENKEKGSPVLAAQHAHSLRNKSYQLRCVNVEPDDQYFRDLEQNTQVYRNLVTNFHGTFADHVDTILGNTGVQPTLFFIDPFGVKGMEWQVVSKVLQRDHITEILLRVDQNTIQRLAGFSGSTYSAAQGKRQCLNEYFGFSDSSQWEQVWHSAGIEGLLRLYMRRLAEGMNLGDSSASYVCSYPIRSIEGDVKYRLMFATRHPKGAILMSNTVYGREETYEREVEDYKASQPRQLSMFDIFKPTEEEIFADKVSKLKEGIWQKFQGKTASRLDVHQSMLGKWFGRVKGSHFTRAFKEMDEDGRIVDLSGPPSNDYTQIVFRD